MVVMKFDAIAALFVGAVLGGVFAIIFQPTMVTKIAGLDLVPSVTATAESGEAELVGAELSKAFLCCVHQLDGV